MDYEELRKKNIAERQAEFAEFFKELKAEKKELKKTVKPRPKSRVHLDSENSDDAENQPPKKKRRSNLNYTAKIPRIKKTYNTRSKAMKNSEKNSKKDIKSIAIYSYKSSDDELEDKVARKGRSLKVIFPWAKTFEREMEVSSMEKWDVDKELAEDNDFSLAGEYDSDESSRSRRRGPNRVTKSEYDPDSIPSVDEITHAMLKNVATKSSGKEYCKYKGTSCHQCRQKTLDTKTVCRSGECIGVRGQFCGPCLRGRYGEDAVKVLKDPNWSCPPCRGLCNCSICRTKNGQRPTGILAPVAHEEGFESVMDYLRATSGDEVDEDEEADTS